MTPDLLCDQLIGMGCAARLSFSWGGNPGVGSLHRLRDAVEKQWPGPLALTEFTHAELAVAYQAGASGLTCGLMRRYADTDLAQLPGAAVRTLSCPFTGAALTAVPAVNPQLTILHAQQIDAAGNVLIRGIVGAAKEAAMAAQQVLVTVGLSLAGVALLDAVWGADSRPFPRPAWTEQTTNIDCPSGLWTH